MDRLKDMKTEGWKDGRTERWRGKTKSLRFSLKRGGGGSKICVPTLLKIFRPVTLNTFFHLALATNDTKKFSYSSIIHLFFDSGGDVCRFFYLLLWQSSC